MKKGVLLVNLGSPDSPNPKDVKKYLGEFLMDPRVIDVPKWARTLLVKGIILNTRPKQSAKAYQKIWWENGSPLIVISEELQQPKTMYLVRHGEGYHNQGVLKQIRHATKLKDSPCKCLLNLKLIAKHR